MGLLNALKEILGIAPVNIGELNRQATHARPSPPPVPPRVDPLEGIEITEEYRTVAKLIDARFPIVFVSGKAGTGKTTLIHYLRHTNKNVVVVAPTGVAALNVMGTTIHSYFRFPPRIVTDEDIKEVKDRRLYTKLDLLVVDEISMVRADLVDAMDKFLRVNGKHQDRPFGGTQLLLVGDLFQLPPVVTRSEESVLFARKYSSPFFFSAKSLENCQLAPVELGKIFRQRDPVFTDMLNKVRVAEELDTVIPKINTTCSAPGTDSQHIITLTCTNVAADQVNARELARLPGEPRVFVGEVSGRFAVEDEKLPAPLNLELKLGAQVMFTKNAEQKRWVNGTLGRVIAFKESSIQVELITDHPGALHEVQRVKWESFKYVYDYANDKIKPVTTGQYIQYPLMLAWAVTIHKSQGKTLERVRVDLGDGAFASGQVYVALSRCRSLSDISLARPIDQQEVKCDQRIKRFYLALAGLQSTVQTAAQPQDEAPISVPSDRSIKSDNQTLWCANGNGYWIYEAGKLMPAETTSAWRGDDLLVYNSVSHKYYLLEDYKNRADNQLRPAKSIKSDNQTLWCNDGKSYWLYEAGIAINNQTTSAWRENDLLVYHSASSRYFLLEDYKNRADNQLRPAKSIKSDDNKKLEFLEEKQKCEQLLSDNDGKQSRLETLGKIPFQNQVKSKSSLLASIKHDEFLAKALEREQQAELEKHRKREEIWQLCADEVEEVNIPRQSRGL